MGDFITFHKEISWLVFWGIYGLPTAFAIYVFVKGVMNDGEDFNS